jgi:hypothetical protein
MKKFGPLRHHHCFRFEAKNVLLLEMKHKNFIDVAYSMVTNHQYWMACKQGQVKKRKTLGDSFKILRNVDLYEK